MEIVTYILGGAIAHKDSSGGGGTIRPGEIQRMSAGAGIVHAEFNASATETCHLLQIWIMPSKRGIEPGYEQKTIDPESVHNQFARIAAPDRGRMKCGWCRMRRSGPPSWMPAWRRSTRWRQGRKAWLQVAKGEVKLGEETLKAGDAAAITDQDEIAVRSNAPSEVLLFDLV